jgi:tetratricopeptide (TPR) repeat protein
VGVAGCASVDLRFLDVQEKVHNYNEDGVNLYQHAQYEDARESFQAALSLKPNDGVLLYNLGQCYEHMADYPKAEEAYRQCLDRLPAHTECRHALIALLTKQNRRQEAAQMVDDWIVRDPKSARAYAEDGWLWHRVGDLPRAQARLQQALELDPHEQLALTELGKVYEEMHRPDRAVALYDRVLADHPDQPEVTRRVNALLMKGAGQPRPD